MAEIRHCLSVSVNKEGMSNNWQKGIPSHTNFGQRRIISKDIFSYKSFFFDGYFVSKKCQKISLPTSFTILISIILGTNLPVTDAAMLGDLRKEKIL